MALYTSNYLKALSQSFTINETNTKLFSANEDTIFDIFLSHCFLDREEIKGIYIELTQMGYKVYVDWIIDPHLDRNNVTKETAELIRKRMKSSKTLLLAISANAEISKWMPWELGYVDGKTNRCAIIPVSKDNTHLFSFNRREYLLLYPYIDRVNDRQNIMRLWVNENETTYVQFENWIDGQDPFVRT